MEINENRNPALVAADVRRLALYFGGLLKPPGVGCYEVFELTFGGHGALSIARLADAAEQLTGTDYLNAERLSQLQEVLVICDDEAGMGGECASKAGIILRIPAPLFSQRRGFEYFRPCPNPS
jgi:hypothetical protein